MNQLEIERKFLLRPCSPRKFLSAIGAVYDKYQLEQYYLPVEKYKNTRYRKKGKKFFKTIKSSHGMIRNEEEYQVQEAEYLEYYKEHVGRVIQKDRFVFEYEGDKYELDRFKKDFKGLFYLEIEFSDVERANSFVLPQIFDNLYITEVTENSRFDNSSLSQPGHMPLLQTNLEKLSRKMEIILPTQINEFPLQIAPFESTETAILAIFHNRIEITKEKRAALQEDMQNSQKLCEFWISLRKLRALMGEFEEFFDPVWYARHRKNITMMMTQTDIKRDLNIFLKSLEEYTIEMPHKRGKHLQPLVGLLVEKGHNLLPKIEGLVNSELLDYELASLAKPKTAGSRKEDNLLQPMIITSIQLLQNRVAHIIKEGKKIDFSNNSQSCYHLRIEFKKLCTFIENTKPFVVNSKYTKAIDLIQKMEALLGVYDDLEFQRLLLLSIKSEPTLNDPNSKKAIKALKNIIAERQERQKSLFKVEFNYFLEEKKRLIELFYC